MNLDQAIVYDVETLPNCFTLNAQPLFGEWEATFEISEFRDDRRMLFPWFAHWEANAVPMIGYNNLAFDYEVLHFMNENPGCTAADIFERAQEIIRGSDSRPFRRWGERFAPQIDLYKIHHFDNAAKRTSLKALQVNMRSPIVLDMPIPWDVPVTAQQVNADVVPYNRHDVGETKRFAHFSMDALKFRLGLVETLGPDCINYNDTKIGAKILEKRLGRDLCYNSDGPRGTFRDTIPLADIIFPFIRFSNPEFARVLAWMKTQTLTGNELTGNLETKGVFTGVKAHVGGLDFCFGTGGIHGSVAAQRFAADAEWAIVDVDVASLYPSIAIVNRLYPAHLGVKFVEEYARLPAERKDWQKRKGKKCVEANSLKLAANGTYGNSNNQFSPFYDPQFTMSITINGQLLLCMLAEWLLTVPTLQIIQINTDGITYKIRREHMGRAEELRAAWQAYTRLTLEDVEYSRMWIRDVNNYIAEDLKGELKRKGAYWYPVRFPEDISESQPPAWHKDFSAIVSQMAAVEHMTKGVAIETFIYEHAEPFHFMCRAKVDRSSKLYIGDKEAQRITRYYVARDGGALRKVSPPTGRLGEYKRKNGISDNEYYSIRQTLAPGVHDPRIHTKNKSKYEIRETGIEAGWLVADCNRATDFDFNNVQYDYYVEQAKRLVIP